LSLEYKNYTSPIDRRRTADEDEGPSAPKIAMTQASHDEVKGFFLFNQITHTFVILFRKRR
jgi:hypothetical protein